MIRAGRLLIIMALFYAGLALLLAACQSQLVHQPLVGGRDLVASPADIGLDYRPLEFETKDGERLHGWWVPADDPRATLLFFHGNAGNISHRLRSLAIFNELGLDVLLFDYRGYGQSTGRPSEAGLYRDARAALNCVQNACGLARDEDLPLVYFGRSLGGAVAAWLAVREPPRALIIESAFTSVPELAADLYPWLPVRWLARLEYNTRDAVTRVEVPVLVIHSREDEIIPFGHGEAIVQAAAGPASLLEMQGDHNTGFIVSDETYRRGLASFLDTHFGSL